ncbi:SulP family inorganic anion transporter [Kaistia algarum]|uniref:SulP family inorganic anion transporter n=1 Tax=Kaistia algarum TaxID=2083279 RepID=UPI000CE8C6D0|nr:SulP family inorganic anion transporter [Kaistia algarum]MCX5512962.1 SulP family inorganic anion transporter [Kaistia algarum]PPE81550.1 SulP family inorganic anion transporter [Kaistia algarum]
MISAGEAREGAIRRLLGVAARIDRWAPGITALRHYDRADLPADLRAGVAVAAVAIPVGIAYSELAGFRPEYGLYACFVPPLVYAVFGSSRQMIVGPDAATCAVLAAAVTPLAAGDPVRYAALAGMLTLLAGLICLLASLLRLGTMADFLSKPILVGLLNGIALTIVLGQLGKLTGIPLQSQGLVLALEAVRRASEAVPITVGIGLAALLVVGLLPRLFPALPAGIVAMALAASAVALLGLDRIGLATLGPVPGGLPHFAFPKAGLADISDLLPNAAALALVSYASLIFSAQSFAAKNGYEVDADQEFAALGASNLAAALSQTFAISGADSRTAVADANGSRTQLTGLIAAAIVGVVLLVFTAPLRYVPLAALGAVLVFAGLSLIDVKTLRLVWRADRVEAAISVLATFGVVGLGITKGVLFAVVLALLRFIQLTARPSMDRLGSVDGLPGFHALRRHKTARPVSGLVILRFNAPLVFFNAGHFRKELLAEVAAAPAPLKAVVIDLLPITRIDVSGLFTLRDIADALARRGVRLVGAGRATEWGHWLGERGFDVPAVEIFPTLRGAVRAFRSKNPDDQAGKATVVEDALAPSLSGPRGGNHD